MGKAVKCLYRPFRGSHGYCREMITVKPPDKRPCPVANEKMHMEHIHDFIMGRIGKGVKSNMAKNMSVVKIKKDLDRKPYLMEFMKAAIELNDNDRKQLVTIMQKGE